MNVPRQRAQLPDDRQGGAHAKSRAAQRSSELRKAPEDVLGLFEALIDAMPDAMAVVDQTSTIVLVNAQTERLFGYARDELLGKPVDILVPDRFRNAHREHRSAYCRAPCLRLMGSGMDFVAARRDGKEFPVEISLSPIETIAGPMIVCAIRDVTVQRTAQRAAEQAKLADAREANEQLVVEAVHARMVAERAEQDSHLKDEFLATVSHELRTPLNAVVGWARMLESGQLPPERAKHAIAAIQRGAAALARMIEDLLDTSRMLKGAIRLVLRPVDLAAVAQQAIDVIRPLAATKNVHVAFDAVAGPRTISGDPDRLQQVIWNLLANAITFTPEGGHVNLVVESAHDHMEVRVVDTGCGISSDLLPHVFERFRQAEDATTQRHTGLGLGLSIVRQLVELHGGTVRAASPGVGHGATFTVRLPMAGGSTPAGQPGASPASASPATRSVRILVV